ncbi:MAG: histidine kinase [Chromatiales bacterium]|nr:histidine kinase [Chromatiales bacterium]
MHRLFSPLNIEPIKQMSEQVQLHSEGVSLAIPGFRDISGVRLSYADHGNRLFNTDDLRLASAVHQLFCHIQKFRDAFADGVHEERRRLARDLHDDVGARLLSLVYSATNERNEDLARETLGELRTVIHDLEIKSYSLVLILSELRMETAERCEHHNVILKWHQTDKIDEYLLEARQHANLKRILRETVTNALRHSSASNLEIDVMVEDRCLTLKISNDNVHFDANSPHKPGRGMRNISSRVEELGGSVEWLMDKASLLGGYTVRILIPLKGEITTDE